MRVEPTYSAKQKTPHRSAQISSEICGQPDRQEEACAEREPHRARHLSLYVDDDGSYVIRGRLDPEVGALLSRALDAASAALYRKPDASETPSGEPGEEITAVQRKADAIGLVAECALCHSRNRRKRRSFRRIPSTPFERSIASSGSR